MKPGRTRMHRWVGQLVAPHPFGFPSHPCSPPPPPSASRGVAGRPGDRPGARGGRDGGAGWGAGMGAGMTVCTGRRRPGGGGGARGAAGGAGGAAAPAVAQGHGRHRREAAVRHQLAQRGPVPGLRHLLRGGRGPGPPEAGRLRCGRGHRARARGATGGGFRLARRLAGWARMEAPPPPLPPRRHTRMHRHTHSLRACGTAGRRGPLSPLPASAGGRSRAARAHFKAPGPPRALLWLGRLLPTKPLRPTLSGGLHPPPHRPSFHALPPSP